MLRLSFAFLLVLLQLTTAKNSDAAITYVGQGSSSFGINAGTTVFSFGAATTSTSDILILALRSASNPGTVTVSDNLNGSWTQITNTFNATNAEELLIFFVQVKVSGDPSISVVCPSSPYGYAFVLQFTGFAHTATLDASAGGYAHSNTAVATWTNPAISNFNNEVLFALIASPQGPSATPAGWTPQLAYTNYYAIESTPTNIAISQAFSSNSIYDSYVAGIYDAAAGCTNAGETSTGTSAVPNGTAGSYVGNAGAFVTPNCSSTQYFQPSGGKFGTTFFLPPLAALGWALERRRKLKGRKS